MTSSTTIDEQKNTIRKLNKRSRIFRTIIHAIQEKKGENIVSIDLRKIPEAVADYFVICEAGSSPQVRAIAEEIEDKVRKELKEKPFEKEGLDNLQWVILDYVNIVVHIFQPGVRHFYNLEGMWDDTLQETHES